MGLQQPFLRAVQAAPEACFTRLLLIYRADLFMIKLLCAVPNLFYYISCFVCCLSTLLWSFGEQQQAEDLPCDWLKTGLSLMSLPALCPQCWSNGRISHTPFYFVSAGGPRAGVGRSPPLPLPLGTMETGDRPLFSDLCS